MAHRPQGRLGMHILINFLDRPFRHLLLDLRRFHSHFQIFISGLTATGRRHLRATHTTRILNIRQRLNRPFNLRHNRPKTTPQHISLLNHRHHCHTTRVRISSLRVLLTRALANRHHVRQRLHNNTARGHRTFTFRILRHLSPQAKSRTRVLFSPTHNNTRRPNIRTIKPTSGHHRVTRMNRIGLTINRYLISRQTNTFRRTPLGLSTLVNRNLFRSLLIARGVNGPTTTILHANTGIERDSTGFLRFDNLHTRYSWPYRHQYNGRVSSAFRKAVRKYNS